MQDPVYQAKACQQKGVKIIGIGVTEHADMKELKKLASAPLREGYATTFKAEDFTDLANILQPFLFELMGQACHHE